MTYHDHYHDNQTNPGQADCKNSPPAGQICEVSVTKKKAPRVIGKTIQIREATAAGGLCFKVGRIEADGSTTLHLSVNSRYLLRWYDSPQGRYSYREYPLAIKQNLSVVKKLLKGENDNV